MMLLKDTKLFAIKVDYYMWSEEKGEYLEPHYLSIDTETKRKDGTSANLIVFREQITSELRVFLTKTEVTKYKREKCKDAISFTNARIIEVMYNFETGNWEEI